MSDFIFDLGFKVDQTDVKRAEEAIRDVGLEIKKINKETGEIQIKVNNKEMNLTAQQIAKIGTAMEQASREGRDFGDSLARIGITKATKETALLTNELKDLQNSMKRSAKESKQMEQEIKELSRAAQQAAVSIKTADSAFDQLRTNMAQGLGQTVAFGAIAGIGGAFVSAIQETMELDKVLTDLQIVSEGTREEMEAMADSAFELAGGLGTTGQKFLEASLIFEQQGGLAAQYAKEMAEATVIASNVTGQSMEEMSDQITSVANGYGLLEQKGGEAGLYITDVMAKLGAVSGSSLDEMAAALQRTATVADLAGYSFEEITAQIATVSEVTRRSPEVIGTAFKSIILSFQQLREAGAKELEVFTSKVEEAFKLSGMDTELSIFDDTGNLRDARDIMIDIAGQWDKMSREGQALISESVAGKEQAEVFAVLMENWDRSQELLVDAQTAQGTALEQQDIYMESLQAKTEQLKNEWGELVHNIIDSDIFKGLLEGMTGFLEGFNSIESTVGKIAALMGPLVAAGASFFKFGDSFAQSIGQSNLEKQQEAIRKQFQEEEGLAGDRVRREQQLIQIRETLGEQAASLYNQEKSNLDILSKRLEMFAKIELKENERMELQAKGEDLARAGLKQEIDLNQAIEKSRNTIQNSVDARNDLNQLISQGKDLEYTSLDVKETQLEIERSHGVVLQGQYETLESLYRAYGRLIAEENEMLGGVRDTLKYQERIDTELDKQLATLQKISQEEVERGIAGQKALDQEISRTNQMTAAIEGAADKSERWSNVLNIGIGALGGLTAAIPLFETIADKTATMEEKMSSFGNTLLSFAPTMAFMFAPPAGLIIGAAMAVGALVLKFADFRSEMEKVKDINEGVSKSYSELNQKVTQLDSIVKDSNLKEYTDNLSLSQEELNKKLEENGESYEQYADRMAKTNEEAQKRIADIAPHLVQYYDEEGNAVVDVANAYKQLRQEQEELRTLQASMMASNVGNFAMEYGDRIKNIPVEQEKANKSIEKYNALLKTAYASGDRDKISEYTKKLAEQREQVALLNKEMVEVKGNINQNIVQPMLETNKSLETLPTGFKALAAELVNVEKVSSIMKNSLNPEKEIQALQSSMSVALEAYDKFRVESLSGNEEMKQSWEVLAAAPKETLSYLTLGATMFGGTVDEVKNKIGELVTGMTYVTDESGKIVSAFATEIIDVDTIFPSEEELKARQDRISNSLKETQREIEETQKKISKSNAELMQATAGSDYTRISPQANKAREESKAAQEELNELKAKENGLIENETSLNDLIKNQNSEKIQAQRELTKAHYEQLAAASEIPEVYNVMVDELNKMNEIIDDTNFLGITEQLQEFVEVTEDAKDGVDSIAEANIEDFTMGIGGAREEIEAMAETMGEDFFKTFEIDKGLWDDFTDRTTEAFDEVTEKMLSFKDEYTNMVLALNKDNAEFFSQLKQDASNTDYFNEVALELGVMSSNYATYGEFVNEVNRKTAEMQTIYQDTQAKATYNRVVEDTLIQQWGAEQFAKFKNGEIEMADVSGNAQADISAATAKASAVASAQAQANMAAAQLRAVRAATDTAKGVKASLDGIELSTAAVDQAVQQAEAAYLAAEANYKAIQDMSTESFQSSYTSPVGNKISVGTKPSAPSYKPVGGGGGGSNKNQKPGGGSGGSSKKPSSSGSDKGKEDVEDLELDIDPYKYFNEVLADIEDSLNRVQKAQDEAFGDEKRKLMEDEMKILQQQLATQEELFKTQKSDLTTRAERMKSYGFEIDAMGNLANYNERIIQLTKEANSKTGQAKEIAQEQLKFIQDQAKEYEQLREEAQKMGDEMKEIRKELEQTYLDFITSFKDEADEASKILNDIWDLQDEINDGFDGIGERFENSIKRVEDSMSNVQNSFALIKQISESTDLSDETKQEKMKELIEDVLDEIGDLNDAWKELQELQVEALEEGVDLFEEQIDKIKELNDNMEDFGDLLTDIYGDAAYEQVLEMNKLQLQGIEDQLAGYDKMINQYTTYLGTLEEGSDAWNETKKIIDDLNQDKLELSIEKIEKMKDIADQMFEKALSDLEEAMFGPGGLDAFGDKFDKVEKDQEKYVSNLEKARLISELTAKIQKEIEKTNDPKRKAQLQKFLEEEVKLLGQKDKLTHTEVERAQLLYDLELQRLALNERQQALMTAQLTRDESGGFSYQYVKEPTKKKEDDGEMGNKLNDLIALDQEALRENQQEIMDVYEQLLEDIGKLDPMSNTYETDLENLRIAAIEQMRILEEEQKRLIANAQQSGIAGILEGFASTDGLVIFGEGIDSTIEQLTDALSKGSITFNEIMSGDFAALAEKTGLSAEEIETAYNAMISATTEDWTQGNLDMDLSTEALKNAVQDYIDKMTDDTDGYGYYKDKITEAIKAHQDALGSLDIAMDTNQKNLDETIGKIGTTTTEMGKLNTSIGGPGGLKSQLDAVNKVIGSSSDKNSFLGKLEQVAQDAKKQDNGLIQTGKNAEQAKTAMNNAKASANALKDDLKTMSTSAKNSINEMWNGSKAALDNTISKIKSVGSTASSAAGTVGSAASSIASSVNSALGSIGKLNSAKVTGPKLNTVDWVTYWKSEDRSEVKSTSGTILKTQGDARKAYGTGDKISWEKGGFTGDLPNYYTGDGSRSGGVDGIGGMPAILHPREFVMNREMTERMVRGVDIIQNYAAMLKNSGLNSTPSALGPITQSTPVAQDIHITAEFPNATNRSEIEDTFRNLSNLSLQWAHKTKSS